MGFPLSEEQSPQGQSRETRLRQPRPWESSWPNASPDGAENGRNPFSIYRYETIRPPRGPALAPFVALAEESNLPQLAETFRASLKEIADLLQTDRSSRDRNTERVSGYDRLFRLFLNSLTAVAVIKDSDGTILWGNPEYEHLTSWHLTDLVGKKISDVWPLQYADDIIAHDNQVVREKSTIAVFESVPVEGKDYVRFTIRFPIFDETGTDVVMVGALGCYWHEVAPQHLKLGRTVSLSSGDEVAVIKRRAPE